MCRYVECVGVVVELGDPAPKERENLTRRLWDVAEDYKMVYIIVRWTMYGMNNCGPLRWRITL